MNDSTKITNLLFEIAATPSKYILLSKSDSQETNDAIDRCLDLDLIKEISHRTFRLSEAGNFIVDNEIDYDQYLISEMSDNQIVKNSLTELYENRYYTLNIQGARIDRIEKRLVDKGLITINAATELPSLTSLGD